jgi:zinc D-Ala-D-Ala dipeptidase
MPRLLPAAALLASAALLAGCAPGAPASIEAPPQPVASDALADSVLVDVRSADSTIQVDARYATANNFTGAPLPGYQAPRALLRR